jgi:ribosomal-protein-alanine N-acetyltransferase
MKHPIINDTIFNKFPNLKSERLKFRSFKKKDAKAYFLLRSNPLVMKQMDAPYIENIEVAKQKINEIKQDFKDQKGINWSIVDKKTGEWMGYFGVWSIDKKNSRGQIGYALAPEYWKKGYMAETFDTLLEFSFKTLHLHSIEANINPQNKNSEQVLKRMGFRQEAYFRENYFFNGHFTDSMIYCLLADDWDYTKYF